MTCHGIDRGRHPVRAAPDTEIAGLLCCRHSAAGPGHWSDHCGFFSGGCDLAGASSISRTQFRRTSVEYSTGGVSIGGFDKFPWSPIHFHAFEQETQTFRWVGAFQGANFNLTDAGDPAMLEGAQFRGDSFPPWASLLHSAARLPVKKIPRARSARWCWATPCGGAASTQIPPSLIG